MQTHFFAASNNSELVVMYSGINASRERAKEKISALMPSQYRKKL